MTAAVFDVLGGWRRATKMRSQQPPPQPVSKGTGRLGRDPKDILPLLLYLDTQHWVLIAMELIGIGCITPAGRLKLAAYSTTATQ